jgi:succinoglycan biosynthesis transport protein ExoP
VDTYEVRTIARYDIVEEALKRLGPRRFLWQQKGESDRRATERLMGALQVRPVPDTYLITVGLEGRTFEGLAEIVNTVVETYLTKHKQQEFYGSDVRVENLVKRRTELLKEIQMRVESQTTLAQELGITTFEEKFIARMTRP